MHYSYTLFTARLWYTIYNTQFKSLFCGICCEMAQVFFVRFIRITKDFKFII